MPFLTIAGITIEVDATGAEELEAVRTTERVRSFDGSWLTTVGAEFRVRQFRSYEMTETAYNALRDAIASYGGVPPVGGEAMGFADATTIDAAVTITGSPYVWKDGGGFVREAVIRVEE